jgi:hypothetical protein
MSMIVRFGAFPALWDLCHADRVRRPVRRRSASRGLLWFFAVVRAQC